MTLARLSPDWIADQIENGGTSTSEDSGASQLVKRLAEPLTVRTGFEADDPEARIDDLARVNLLHQVLLDSMTSVLSISGLTGQRVLSKIDRQDVSRGLLSGSVDGFVEIGSLHVIRRDTQAPVPGGLLTRILSESFPLGP